MNATGRIIAALLVSGLAATASGQPSDEADRLYANRVDLASAERAAAAWEATMMRDPSDFAAAWKLARACYWLGGHVAMDRRRAELERGVAAGRHAAAIAPNRPE